MTNLYRLHYLFLYSSLDLSLIFNIQPTEVTQGQVWVSFNLLLIRKITSKMTFEKVIQKNWQEIYLPPTPGLK